VRIIKLALNQGISGQLDGPSSYLMKSPHNQRPDSEAREMTEAFIAEHARKAPGERAKELAPEQPAT
jgi:myo-inositol-1-phosphate synthase